MCPVAICKAARLGGPYAAISQTRFSLRRWTIGPLPVSLYHRWTPWSPIKQKRNYYRDSFAILVHGSCVTFRGSFLSEGVSADDWGGSAGGAAPVHGIPFDVFVFCEFWCTGHSSRGRRARGTEEWKSQRDGRTEGWNDGGPEGRRSNICLEFVLATETSCLSPAHAASPRPLARTNETKRFPGVTKRTHPPNLQSIRAWR